MSDPNENTAPQAESLPTELGTDVQRDELSPRDHDREEPVDDAFEDLLSETDDIDPDIAP